MNLRRWLDGWRFVLLTVLTVAFVRWAIEAMLDDFEVSLVINEPWEHMRLRSRAAIGPEPPGNVWSNQSKSGVRLHFNDPEYGFLTPLARDFTIRSRNERVKSVRLSPQTEPLSLDDALEVVLGLHGQLHKKGWVAAQVLDDPAIADTPEWRAWFRNKTRHAMSLWLAGDRYQLMLELEPVNRPRRPTDERYSIILSIDEPWLFDQTGSH
jgi:hypothetical protein